jgi:hypothetical protein
MMPEITIQTLQFCGQLFGLPTIGARGCGVPKSHHCVDCGRNTGPGAPIRAECLAARRAGIPRVTRKLQRGHEFFLVRRQIWRKAGMTPWGGSLCIGCIEKRIGRRLNSEDFVEGHPFHQRWFKRTASKRLRARLANRGPRVASR